MKTHQMKSLFVNGHLVRFHLSATNQGAEKNQVKHRVDGCVDEQIDLGGRPLEQVRKEGTSGKGALVC